MIKNPSAMPAVFVSGTSAFFGGWRAFGLKTSAEITAGVLIFVIVVSFFINRSPRLSAAMSNPARAEAVSAWLQLTIGACLGVFGLLCVGAGRIYIPVGLICLIGGGALVRAGRRNRRRSSRRVTGCQIHRTR
jgi:hypothetical protein